MELRQGEGAAQWPLVSRGGGGVGGASNALRLKSQPLCPEHRVEEGGLVRPIGGGITAKNLPPTDGWLLGSGPSEMVHGQAQLSLREPRRGSGATVTGRWGSLNKDPEVLL